VPNGEFSDPMVGRSSQTLSFRLVGMSIECQKQVSLGSTPFHAFTHLSGEPGSWDYRPIEEPTDEG